MSASSDERGIGVRVVELVEGRLVDDADLGGDVREAFVAGELAS